MEKEWLLEDVGWCCWQVGAIINPVYVRICVYLQEMNRISLQRLLRSIQDSLRLFLYLSLSLFPSVVVMRCRAAIKCP